ncbi:prolactin-2B1-like [Peromyscus leucopus]|uniref:prolactin-2B1-like n=1 Tax=Peromyscus leucopus TaxID=10041 RepID=UPI001884C183|nr:prolactin-2B1-like [Peromyscus leucopus]
MDLSIALFLYIRDIADASTPTNDSGCGFGEMLTEDLFDDAVQHINGLAIETARTLLLFLVSNLLLWENAASAPTCVKRDLDTQKSLERLVKLAAFVSKTINSQAGEIFTEFDEQYAHGKRYNDRVPDICPTDFFETPVNKEQVLKSNPEVLLQLVYKLLYSWANPLHHLVNEISIMQGDPYSILYKTRQIKAKIEDLTEGIKIILSKIGEKANESYRAWSGLSALQSSNEDVRCFTFYNLFRCMLKDSHRINTFLEVLKYRIIHENNC